MNVVLEKLKSSVRPEHLLPLAVFIVVLILVWLSFKLLHRIVMKHISGKCRLQTQQIVSKIIRYTGFVVIIFSILNKLDINLSAVLGAAGIAGIAIGFAAQTTISNVISGLFVMTERTFEAGDFITVDGVSGTVESVDILSIKLKTPDNQLVRVPNETVIKSSVTNITHYPVRRISIDVGVSYGSDLKAAQQQLLSTAKAEPLALSNPEPAVHITAFAPSSITLQLWVWTKKEDFKSCMTSLFLGIHTDFQKAAIEIPMPQFNVEILNGRPVVSDNGRETAVNMPQ